MPTPAAAHAADAFVGVTGGNQLVHFSSDTIPGLSAATSIDGLPGGERIVALDAGAPGELIALGRSGTLYALDAAQHKVTRTAGGFGLPIPAGKLRNAQRRAGRQSARVIAAGRDRTVDLATGAVTADVPRRGDIAADLGTDGVLRGVDPASNSIVTLDGTGEHVVASLDGHRTHSPTAVTTAADGTLWITTGLALHPGGPKQSRLLRFDPKTGQLHAINSYLFQQLDALAATGTDAGRHDGSEGLGPHPASEPRERAQAPRLPRRDHDQRARPDLMSARVGSSYRAFGFATAIHGGKLRVLAPSKQARIRATAGHRVRLHIAVHDWAGNTKVLDRYFTLAR